MKIGIQTWGSNGDIRPMLALAEGLQKNGHSVTLLVSSIDDKDYSAICRELNIRYLKIPQQIRFDMPAFAEKTLHMNTLQWLNALLEEVFFPYEREIYQAALQLASDNDCLLGHHFLYPLKLAAKLQQKPFISITLCHAAITTTTFPPFRFPNLGRSINKLQWKVLHIIFDFALKKQLGILSNQVGLPDFGHVYPGLLTSDLLNLVAVDPLFCDAQNEWAPVHKICGFLNLSEQVETWEPHPTLKTFLQQGEQPVYMTFGSLQQAVAERSMELFIEAAHLSGCRAIIQTSSKKYPANTQQDNIFFIGKHPHQRLFEQCAAVVHHGGAGTTHAASLSGCPSAVVPFMDEQLFWACRLQKSGLAGKPLPAKKADARELAKRILLILNSPEIRKNAASYGKHMQQQQGVANAVSLIERAVVGFQKNLCRQKV